MKRYFSSPVLTLFFTYTLFISSTFTIAGQDASIIFLYLLGIYSLIRNRKLPDMSHPMLWMFLLFTAFSLISGVLNQYEVDALMNLRSNWRMLLPFVLLTVLHMVDEENLLKTYYAFWLFIAVYGIVQFFNGADWFRPQESSVSTPYMSSGGESGVFHAKGNFTHHLTFGGSMLICSSLAASFLFIRGMYLTTRLLMIPAVLILWLSTAASLGRSIWVGLTVALFLLLLRISPKLMIIATVLLTVTATLLFMNFGEGLLSTGKPETRIEIIQHRLASGFNLKSNRDRLLMWKSAWHGIRDHFWLGIGFQKDAEVMEPYREKIIQETGHHFINSAGVGVHNIYLQTWLNFGIFGFISYLGIWIVFFYQVVKGISNTQKFDYSNCILWGALAGIGGFMAAGFFENNFRDGEVQTSVLLLVSLALYEIQKQRSLFLKKRSSMTMNRIL